jgi:hypothetical protein
MIAVDPVFLTYNQIVVFLYVWYLFRIESCMKFLLRKGMQWIIKLPLEFLIQFGFMSPLTSYKA